jgi:very-short-patch-repair endonuclease
MHKKLAVQDENCTTHEQIVRFMCKINKIKQPKTEFKFLETRKFRFDFCWPDKMLALEVEGGVWTAGRHTRGSGFVKDMEKYNLATCEGWRILRFTPQQIKKNDTYTIIKNCLEA